MKHALKSVAVALAVAMSAVAMPALAHTDEYLATLKAPHDGQLKMAGPYHIELVVVRDNPQAVDKPVAVYLTDHAGTAIATAGAAGTVTLLGGGKKATAKLVPDGGNGFRANAVYTSTLDLKAVVTITLPGKPAVTARFEPVAAVTAPMDHHDHH